MIEKDFLKIFSQKMKQIKKNQASKKQKNPEDISLRVSKLSGDFFWHELFLSDKKLFILESENLSP